MIRRVLKSVLWSRWIVVPSFLGMAAITWAEESLCPAFIATHQELAKPLSGWEPGLVPFRQFLSQILFSVGHPSGEQTVFPDKTVEHKDRNIYTWFLLQDKDYWIQCQYTNTFVVLRKQIPKGTKFCELVQDKRGENIGSRCE
jgi:hypothetical protein